MGFPADSNTCESNTCESSNTRARAGRGPTAAPSGRHVRHLPGMGRLLLVLGLLGSLPSGVSLRFFGVPAKSAPAATAAAAAAAPASSGSATTGYGASDNGAGEVFGLAPSPKSAPPGSSTEGKPTDESTPPAYHYVWHAPASPTPQAPQQLQQQAVAAAAAQTATDSAPVESAAAAAAATGAASAAQLWLTQHPFALESTGGWEEWGPHSLAARSRASLPTPSSGRPAGGVQRRQPCRLLFQPEHQWQHSVAHLPGGCERRCARSVPTAHSSLCRRYVVLGRGELH